MGTRARNDHARKINGRWLTIMLAAVLFMTAIGPAYKVYADDPEPANDPLLQQVEAAIASVSQAVLGTANLDDWQAAGLSAAGKAVPSKYSSALYKKLAANRGTFTSATDYERTVIGMTAAHQDATRFAGYNLIEQIYSYPAISTLNGLDFALLALDSGHYAVPDNAVWTREKLVEAILSKVNPDGGFNWTPSASDPDMTGMTLTALAPYAGQSAVEPVIAGAVAWLSANQLGNGGYASYRVDNSESVSQAIIGLTAIGIDPTEARFTKNGVNLVNRLLSFQLANGSFSHTLHAASNGLATEQALEALAAFDKFKKDGSRLYDYGVRQPDGWASDWLLGANNWSGISEWMVVGLTREGREIPDSYLTTSLPGILDFLTQYPNDAYVTDYERIAIALSALHLDATQYAGINIIEHIYNSGVMEDQGINGLDYALVALDSGEYQTPADAVWNREKLIAAILERQHDDGGFALNSGDSDPDMTAMTLTALAPYLNNPDAMTAGQKAVQWLSANQTDSGGYEADYFGTKSDSSESVSQAIIALTAAGYDPTSAQFTKNGSSLLDKLFTFMQPNGGFVHVNDPSAATDPMATEQALQALAAYEMFVGGKGKLYQFGPPVSIQVEGPAGPIASGNISGSSAYDALASLLADKQVPYVATDSAYGKYVSSIDNIAASGSNGWMYDVNRGGEWSFPGVSIDSFTLQKGDKVAVYYTGSDTALVKSVKVEPAAPKAGETFKVTVTQASSVWNGTTSEIVASAASGVQVKVGSRTVTTNESGEALFDSGIGTAGLYSMEVTGYRTDNAPSLVRHVQPLTVAVKPADPDNGGGGGGTPTTNTITLSVTGDTQKGTILGSKQVTLNAGDTAYTVLERELPGKIRSIGSGATLYVQGIDGLSEKDRGPLSGWMYSVNGVFPNYGAGIYTLRSNDVLAWRYTTNLGEDLGQTPGDWNPPAGGSVPPATSDPVTVVNVPSDIQQDYVLQPTKQQLNTEFQVNIPDVKSKVTLNASDVKDALPKITVNKDKLSLVIEKGTQLLSGNGTIELFTPLDASDASLQALLQGQLGGNDKLDAISHAFIMGAADESFRFDKPLTLTIKGGKGQLAGYIENGSFAPITVYDSEAAGAQATKGSEKITYAFLSGDDLVIKTNHFTSYVTYSAHSVDPNKQYADAALISKWAYDAIGDATSKGFIQGDAGKVNPKANITRAEFAKLMVEVLGLKPTTDASSAFSDVPQRSWFAPYAGAAYKAGFITGYQGRFNPNDTITREQMAAMVVRALALQPATLSAPLKDTDLISAWAKSDVQTIAALQLMRGSDNLFAPRESVTREMAVVVAMRAYAYKQDGQNSAK